MRRPAGLRVVGQMVQDLVDHDAVDRGIGERQGSDLAPMQDHATAGDGTGQLLRGDLEHAGRAVERLDAGDMGQ